MKHIKLFEAFTHTDKEYSQMSDKYNEILNDKAVDITVQRNHNDRVNRRDIILTPTVRIWTGHGTLDEEFSYALDFKSTQTINANLVTVSIHNSGKQINVWKESSILVEPSEISKILRMVNDAKDYIGGVNMSDVESKLIDKLSEKI